MHVNSKRFCEKAKKGYFLLCSINKFCAAVHFLGTFSTLTKKLRYTCSELVYAGSQRALIRETSGFGRHVDACQFKEIL